MSRVGISLEKQESTAVQDRGRFFRLFFDLELQNQPDSAT